MQINKALIVILFFTISGCTSIPTTKMDYTPISVGSSNVNKIVTIHRNFKRKINSSFQSIKSGKTPSNKSVSA